MEELECRVRVVTCKTPIRGLAADQAIGNPTLMHLPVWGEAVVRAKSTRPRRFKDWRGLLGGSVKRRDRGGEGVCFSPERYVTLPTLPAKSEKATWNACGSRALLRPT